jgi:hypothetical protein
MKNIKIGLHIDTIQKSITKEFIIILLIDKDTLMMIILICIHNNKKIMTVKYQIGLNMKINKKNRIVIKKIALTNITIKRKFLIIKNIIQMIQMN